MKHKLLILLMLLCALPIHAQGYAGAQETGTIVVNAYPKDVRVILDNDADVDFGSCTFEYVPIGIHVVRFEKEGYLTKAKEVVVLANETITVDAKLKKIPFDNSLFFTVDGRYRFVTNPSVGFTIGQELNRTGWYFSAASGFGYKSIGATHTCDGSGRLLQNGTVPIYTGKSDYTRLSIVAGALWRVHPMVALYAGAGYGYNSLAWEMRDGEWVRNQARTIQGADIQLGAHVSYKGVVVQAGITTTNFQTIELMVGIGGIFKQKGR